MNTSVISNYKIPTIWDEKQTTLLIGDYKVVWDYNSRCITTAKEGKIIEKYYYPESYTVGQFHSFIIKIIEAAAI